MSILVIGGAGYIGSHIVSMLNEINQKIVIVDDFSTGIKARISNSDVYEMDISCQTSIKKLKSLIIKHQVNSIVHLAAKKSVPESLVNPGFYFQQNVGGLLNILAALESTQVENFVFSSSAAIYGDARGVVNENSSKLPINPYGDSKWIGEQILNSFSATSKLKVVSLRYFNVAGAGSSLLADTSISNLIPMMFEKIMQGQQPQIYGDDYDTIDGTCIRDFIHVLDLASAHIEAINFLDNTLENHSEFNVGTGSGYSVKQVFEVIKQVTGYEGDPKVLPRRAGDPTEVVAEVNKISIQLGWKPRLGLHEMVESAWSAWSA